MPVILWWLLLEALGLLALPLTFPLFGPRMAHGYPFAKIVAPVVIHRLAARLRHPAQHGALRRARRARGRCRVALLQRDPLGAWLRAGGWLNWFALTSSGRSALFFVFQRWMAPDIFGAEKYMDYAFLNGIIRAGMPPPDPWMSGDTINTTFRLPDVRNLLRLPVIISYTCVARSAGSPSRPPPLSSPSRNWNLSLLGGCMSAFLGNLDGFLQFLEKGTLRSMDYWRSSRVVAKGDTINEFPFFSTIHGDLHPHFMVLPVSILLLAILLDERLFPSRVDEVPRSPWRSLVPFALVTFVLGAMVAISNWELPMGVLVVALLAGRAQPLFPLLSRARIELGLRLIGVLVGVYVLFMPFYLDFVPPLVKPGPGEPCIGSACFTIAQTSIAQFLTVFGLLLFPPIVLVISRLLALRNRAAAAKRRARREGRHLAIAAAGLAFVFAIMAGNGAAVAGARPRRCVRGCLLG